VAAALVLVAWKMPHPFPWESFPGFASNGNGSPTVRWFTVFGVLWTVGLFFFSWIFVWLAPAPVTGLLMILFFLLSGLLLVKRTGKGKQWDARRQCGLASGALGFFLLLAPILEFAGGAWPNKNAGMTVAAVVMLAFLGWLNGRSEVAGPISPRNTPPPN
jgi:hypothetical protein